MSAVKSNEQVLINLRNNHKLLARVKAFDRHCNLYVHSPIMYSHSFYEYCFAQGFGERAGVLDRALEGRKDCDQGPRHLQVISPR